MEKVNKKRHLARLVKKMTAQRSGVRNKKKDVDTA